VKNTDLSDESNFGDQLKLRREIVSRVVQAEVKWLNSKLGQLTCPAGHSNCWVHLDRAVNLHCPGGSERKCYAELQKLSDDIRAQIREAEGDAGCVQWEPTEADKRLAAMRVQYAEQVIYFYRNTRPIIFKKPKTVDDLCRTSPFVIPPQVENQWRWPLKYLFSPDSVIWIGESHETSEPEYQRNFRTAQQWLRRPPVKMANGPQWSPAVFPAGNYHRREENVVRQIYFPVEGDAPLSLDEQATAILWLSKVYPLASVTYSGRASLHALFLKPHKVDFESWQRFRALLDALEFDLGNFRRAGTSRCPGFLRSPDKPEMKTSAWQQLLYLDPSVWQRYQENLL